MNTGIDTIRKVVAIIAGTLAIILMVFGLCKKVGLCAETSPLPIYVTEQNYNNTYNISMDRIKQIVAENVMQERYLVRCEEDNGVLLRIYEFTQQPYLFETNLLSQNSITTTAGNTLLSNGNTVYYGDSNYQIMKSTRITVSIDGTYEITQQNTYNFLNIGTATVTGNKFILASGNITNGNDNGVVFEIKQQQQHSKGGVLAEITENDELAETELPQIDTTPPTDTTNNASWFHKILTAIGKLGLNIQSNTITTGNYLQQILTGQRNFFTDFLAVLGTHIGDITDRLDTIIGYDRENQASTLKEDWIAGYNNSDIKAITITGQNMKTTLSNIGSTNTGNLVFGPWRLTYISGHLHLVGNYTMPEIFGGGTHQQDISFEWYESIRSWFVNIFKVFLFVGFAWYLVTQVPNMLHGTSGVFEKGRKEK